MTLHIVAFAGVLRSASFNRKLLANATQACRELGAEIDLVDLRDADIPFYDGDLEAKGLPPSVQALRARIARADALLIASPEYNGSIPGVLKNAIDWVSRPPEQPFRGKVAGIMGATPGPSGCARALPDLRKILSALGVFVIPMQVGLGGATEAFDAGILKDLPKKNVAAFAQQLVDITTKLAVAR
jgi:chromate reductase